MKAQAQPAPKVTVLRSANRRTAPRKGPRFTDSPASHDSYLTGYSTRSAS